MENIWFLGSKPLKVTGTLANGPAADLIAAVASRKIHIIHYEFSTTTAEEGTLSLLDNATPLTMDWTFDRGIIIPYKRLVLATGNAFRGQTTHANGLRYEYITDLIRGNI